MNKALNQECAVSVLYKWFKDNINTFTSVKAETEFRDSGKGTAYVRIDTKAFMTELYVFDVDNRLVIEVINMETDETTFPQSGNCETLTEFKQHLTDYVKWFEEFNSL